MQRIIHNLVQGTPEWDAFRLNHNGASEAAAMLGLSKRTTRTELLRAKKTGIAKTFSAFVQEVILEKGHEVEGAARPLANEIVGEELYPATVSLGKESASCDGITMDDVIAWEHKQVNKENIILVRAGHVPEEHMPQCQQVLMVTGAEKLLFMVSDGTKDNMAYVWVLPDQQWFARLLAGWKQFDEDFAAFVPEPVADPAPSGRAPEALPALRIEVTGSVTASNLAAFRDVALTAIRSVNRDLKTDQDFADSAKARKWCDDIEERVAATKRHVLSQTVDIDEVFRTMDEISAEARQVRLDLEKLEKARSTARKQEILSDGQTALGDHLRELNKRLGRDLMPQVPADFAGAIAGKRSFSSMQDAVNTVLANAKITANAVADKIDANLKTLAAVAPEHAALFPDSGTIALKAADDLAALVTARIAQHDAAVKKRADEAAEAAREVIRKEEADKLAAATPAPTPAAVPAPAPVAAPAPTVVSFGGGRRIAAAPTPAPATPPTLKLGDISARLAPISITAEGLKTLGFVPAATQGATKLFHERDFGLICAALVRHIESVQAQQAA